MIENINGHEVRSSTLKYPASVGGGRSKTTYICTKCGKSSRYLFGGSWDEEDCTEHLKKHYELRRMSSKNPARLRNIRNLEFNEVFGDCSDEIEFLERRSVTVDTHHSTYPKNWKDVKPNPISDSPNGILNLLLTKIL